ncbi:MAG: agmatine deiminase family protein [Ilumatobacteraceae bacterium]
MKMPGEFARHERTVICWPTRLSVYGEHIAEARSAHAALARTISGFEPVTMIANLGEGDDARERCGSSVEVVEMPIDDSWFRDTGPIYVTEDSRRVATSWMFNGWGGKFSPIDADIAIARRWAAHSGHDVRQIDMVLEGGSITSDGARFLATTEQCLLNPNRNPTMTKDEIESRLVTELGLPEIIWLPHGLSLDDDTDGHVDNVAIFIESGVIVMQGCADRSLVDHERLLENRRIAEQFDVVIREIPVLPTITYHGERVQVPYLNFYLVNGGAIVPVCGHADDDEMLALLADFMPDREVVGLDIGGILAYGGGGIHCVTQQVPAV